MKSIETQLDNHQWIKIQQYYLIILSFTYFIYLFNFTFLNKISLWIKILTLNTGNYSKYTNYTNYNYEKIILSLLYIS